MTSTVTTTMTMTTMARTSMTSTATTTMTMTTMARTSMTSTAMTIMTTTAMTNSIPMSGLTRSTRRRLSMKSRRRCQMQIRPMPEPMKQTQRR